MNVTIDIGDVILTLLGIGGSIVVYMLKRWMDRVEAGLKSLAAEVVELKVQSGKTTTEQSHLLGGLDLMRRSVSSTDKAVGKLAGAVDKLWDVLNAKGLIKPRSSDGILGKVEGG